MRYMADIKQIDSLSDEEISDIKEFYNNPQDRKVVTLKELHSD